MPRPRRAGTPAAALMERAGAAVARSCLDLLGGAYGRRAVVACGKGSNGGDGLVAARHLARAGVRVAVFADEATGDAGEMRDRLERETASASVRSNPRRCRRRARRGPTLAVDAIAGTGLRGAPDGSWAAAIDVLNASGVPIVAVDIPSGVDGATGAVPGRRGPRRAHRDLRRCEGRRRVVARREFAGRDPGRRHRVRRRRDGGHRMADRTRRRGRGPPPRPLDGHKKTSGTARRGRGFARDDRSRAVGRARRDARRARATSWSRSRRRSCRWSRRSSPRRCSCRCPRPTPDRSPPKPSTRS